MWMHDATVGTRHTARGTQATRCVGDAVDARGGHRRRGSRPAAPRSPGRHRLPRERSRGAVDALPADGEDADRAARVRDARRRHRRPRLGSRRKSARSPCGRSCTSRSSRRSRSRRARGGERRATGQRCDDARRCARPWDAPTTPPPSFVALLEHVVPESVVDAMARNDALQIVVFAMLFAIGLTRVHGEARAACSRCARASPR